MNIKYIIRIQWAGYFNEIELEGSKIAFMSSNYEEATKKFNFLFLEDYLNDFELNAVYVANAALEKWIYKDNKTVKMILLRKFDFI